MSLLSLDPVLQQPLHAFAGEDLVRRFVNNGAVGGPAANGMACKPIGLTNRPNLPEVKTFANLFYWTMTAVAYKRVVDGTGGWILSTMPSGAGAVPGSAFLFRGAGTVSAGAANTAGTTFVDGPTTVAGKLYAMTLVRRNASYGFYVNGEEITASFTPTGINQTTTTPLTVGCNPHVPGDAAYLDGGISLALIHDRALSAQAIIDLQSVLIRGEYQEDIGFLAGMGPEFDFSDPVVPAAGGRRSRARHTRTR